MEQQHHDASDNPRQRWAFAIGLVVFIALSRSTFVVPFVEAIPFNVFFYGLITLAVLRELQLWRRRRKRA